MVKRLLIISIVLAALLIPTGFALAASHEAHVSRSVAPPSTYHIATKYRTTASPGETIFARCNLGETILGGGVALGNLNGKDAITLTRPSGLDGWAGAYTGPRTSIRVYAICVQ